MGFCSWAERWHATGYGSLNYLRRWARLVLRPQTAAERQMMDGIGWKLAHMGMDAVFGDDDGEQVAPAQVIRFWEWVQNLDLEFLEENLLRVCYGRKGRERLRAMIDRQRFVRRSL